MVKMVRYLEGIVHAEVDFFPSTSLIGTLPCIRKIL